jgi:hypothetical protein
MLDSCALSRTMLAPAKTLAACRHISAWPATGCAAPDPAGLLRWDGSIKHGILDVVH